MPAIMVHALDGSMLSSRTGIGKLLRIYRGTEAASSVFVISNVASADLAMDSLVSAAAENDERLWARLERSQKAWNEAAEAMLCQDRPVNDALVMGHIHAAHGIAIPGRMIEQQISVPDAPDQKGQDEGAQKSGRQKRIQEPPFPFEAFGRYRFHISECEGVPETCVRAYMLPE